MSLSQTFIWPAESLEEAEKRRAADNKEMELQAKYSDPQVLQDEKQSLAESLWYKPFSPPKNTPEKHDDSLVWAAWETSLMWNTGNDTLKTAENKNWTADIHWEKESETKKPDEHPESPFIERLWNAISPEIKNNWMSQLQWWTPFPEIVKKSSLPHGLKSSIFSSWENMNTPAGKEKMKADFQADYGKKCEDALGDDGEMSPWDTELLDQIGECYMKWSDTSPKWEEEALNMALKTMINNEVFWKKCNKEAMVYTKNMERINNPSLPLKEKLLACKKVKMYVNRDQGAKAEKYESVTDMIDDADMKAEYQDAINALEFAQQQNNQEEIKVAQEKVLKIINEASELTGTPIWTFDISLETWKSETSQENQKAA